MESRLTAGTKHTILSVLDAGQGLETGSIKGSERLANKSRHGIRFQDSSQMEGTGTRTRRSIEAFRTLSPSCSSCHEIQSDTVGLSSSSNCSFQLLNRPGIGFQ